MIAAFGVFAPAKSYAQTNRLIVMSCKLIAEETPWTWNLTIDLAAKTVLDSASRSHYPPPNFRHLSDRTNYGSTDSLGRGFATIA